MATWYRAVVVGLLVATGATWFFGVAGNTPVAQAAPGEQPVAVLDTKSVWHTYTALKPPVVEIDGAMKPVTSLYPWVDKETPLAPEEWKARGFADETWLRGNALTGPRTPYASNLYLRAKFEVTDPAQVRDLKLSVTYHGGVIVYVNGQEIARGHLAKDAQDATAVAESYPSSVFVLDNGEIVLDYWGYKGPKEAVTGRRRKLTDVAVPASALRKGVNVLAIQAIRAPYDQSVAEYWVKSKRKEGRELGEAALPYDFNWYTCQVREVKLTAAGPAGLVPNVGRAKELQAWNSDVLTSDTYGDVGDRCGTLRPVTIKGPRNGWSSGKVVIGSPKAIEGLKVTCGDLKQGAAIIPAAAMRARYAVAFADKPSVKVPLESLLETPLESFPVVGGGSVVPIWLTVKVPANAKVGTYTGRVTIEVRGSKTLVVPVSLQVANFVVPDTQDYKTWIELMQSPDTLAMEYNVPLWSEKHWELIAQSMRYIGEIGSRVLIIPLIAQTNSGDSESMVRWIKKDDGTYDYDLSIVDRYLDTAIKNMGKPKFVAFTTWEIYLVTPPNEVTNRNPRSEESWKAARWDLRGKGPAATALDPKTGQTSTFNLPRFEDKAAMAAWKPLFDLLHKNMAKRGLEDTMLLGMASDMYPNKKEMATIDKASGSLRWINHTHQGSRGKPLSGGLGMVAYTAYVWPNEYPGDPRKPRLYGWKRPELNVEFRRFGAFNYWRLPAQMIFPELQITGNQRGLGRIGADFWAVMRDKRGRRRGRVWDKYPQSMWHSCNLSSHMLNPGPDGPVATTRYEMLREGMQNCEARIAIEEVLTDDAQKAKLGADLAAKCQQLLDDRIWQMLKGFSGLQLTGRNYTTYNRYKAIFYYNAGGVAGAHWYANSPWQDRQQQLYNLAGEVQRRMGGK
jgi:Glycoside hydrolase 123, catalytic domain/Glycoside hydrolase 123 N-terminal domain